MILNGGYNEQFQRVKRYLEKIKNQDRATVEYSDDIWAFFQNCWHLKDWIKNDPNLPISVKDNVEQEVKNYNSLMICADLANRSKHRELRYIRKDAKLTGIGVTVHVSLLTIHINPREKTELPQKKGYVEHPFYIETSNGNKIDGLSIAIQAVEDWGKLLLKYGLK